MKSLYVNGRCLSMTYLDSFLPYESSVKGMDRTFTNKNTPIIIKLRQTSCNERKKKLSLVLIRFLLHCLSVHLFIEESQKNKKKGK